MRVCRVSVPKIVYHCVSKNGDEKGGVQMPKKSQITTDDVADAIESASEMTTNLAGLETKKRRLTMRSSVKALAIKIYDEQMIRGWNDVKDRIKNINKNRKNKRWWIIAIRHDRDTLSNDIFLPAIEKPHYHIIMRLEKMSDPSTKVSTVLRALGIRFREEDENLWCNHGVELVVKYPIYTLYLLHQTQKAIRDGKAEYKLSELVSNLKRTEIERLLKVARDAENVNTTDMIELEAEAYNLGYALSDWDTWYRSLSLKIRGDRYFRLIRETYDYGVSDRIQKDSYVCRTSIFIRGDSNIGKSFAIKRAIGDRKYVDVSAKKTGKFDDLTPTTEAIIVNDGLISDIQNLCDDNMLQMHRRNSGDRFWCGNLFVATSNDEFEEWLKKCGVPTTPEKKDPTTGRVIEGGEIIDLDSYRNRFFICHVDRVGSTPFLILDSATTRGNKRELMKKARVFETFRDIFNATIATYHPSEYELDPDEMNSRALDRYKKQNKKK